MCSSLAISPATFLITLRIVTSWATRTSLDTAMTWQPLFAISLIVHMGAVSATTIAQELPDPLAAGWQGNDVCELLEHNDSLRVLRCTFPPGVGHERHFHAPHYGYALSGGVMELTDERGTRIATLKTGSDFSSGGTPWHTVLNVGDTTVQYLIIEPR